MQRDEILSLLSAHFPELGRFQVRSLAVFGSVARGEAGPNSDVDILVEFEDAPTFATFMGLKLYLEDLLGVRVDLATPRSLKARARATVERDAVYVT